MAFSTNALKLVQELSTVFAKNDSKTTPHVYYLAGTAGEKRQIPALLQQWRSEDVQLNSKVLLTRKCYLVLILLVDLYMLCIISPFFNVTSELTSECIVKLDNEFVCFEQVQQSPLLVRAIVLSSAQKRGEKRGTVWSNTVQKHLQG